jgi:AmmeMemoRadiSam system protein A
MTADDRRSLLQLARDTIVAHIHKQSAPGVAAHGIFAVRAGAFVTLHRNGELRGCIGHIAADEPLSTVIPRCAIGACSDDPRFPAVTAPELPELAIELSVLGPLVPIAGPDDILVGRDGLVVEEGWHRGLLLPQVAVEWDWNRETFLSQTCHKAGLNRDAWKRGARLWRFEAEVFS